jgi:cilia- and flagella-associated protein 65
MATSNGSSEIMDPNERMKRFGIECVGPYGDGILFAASTWKPGGEYVQKLIVRNVTTTVKKLKYKLPSTRYFSLAYPEVIVLSPGMFKELDVVFRPVVYDPYDDFILFKMNDGEGNFRVPVRALISKLQIRIPYGVELGYCPTHQVTRHTFLMENIGEIDAPFRWETCFPFELNPSHGVIAVGSHQEITITIKPIDASVYVSQVTCYLGEGIHAINPEPIMTTRISAIAKYTFLILSEPKVEFGEVFSGSSSPLLTKEIILRNPTVVPTEFQCLRLDNDCEEVFHITPRSGIVPTQGELAIQVTYTPLAFGTFSQDQYLFQTPSQSSTSAVLTVSGISMPPKVLVEKELYLLLNMDPLVATVSSSAHPSTRSISVTLRWIISRQDYSS